MKQCAKCLELLPLSEFGTNAYYLTRGAHDGRSIYCKGCVREKVYEGRDRKKDMRTAIFWSAVRRVRSMEWLEEAMVCSDCREWFSVKSRTNGVCRKCEAEAIAKAAKEPDSKAKSIAELASWVQTGRSPVRLKRVWEVK